MTIDLSRQLIDYKIAGNKDGNYIVSVNGKQIPNFKETSNTPASRTLEISFGGGDRTIEITGTQMAQGQVSAVKAQLAANKTKESFGSTTKNTGANASQIKANASGGAAGSIVNKTVGILSNITGGIKKILGGR